MIDDHINNPKSIKFYIKEFIEKDKKKITEKTVIDIPAGNGATTEILLNIGAKVEPYDLFPEYFMLDSIECKRADITKGIPVNNQHADILICQEGIEHLSDQLAAFKEFNRTLKKDGLLLITTPSYSNLAAKLNYMFFESEISKKMPPNEIDDIWMSDSNITKSLYHGHIFLIGLQKLRTLGKLSGFKINQIRYTRASKGSLILFPIIYPLILIRSLMAYRRNINKKSTIPIEHRKSIYREQLSININPKNLINKHTFIVFKKEHDIGKVNFDKNGAQKPFNKIM